MKDKIKYYLLLLAFLFIMALILWFFHDWIEQYSNSLMVLITFIYVVATIEICRANIKSAEATKEQLEESKHQFAENERLQMMPYFEIIVHDDIRDFVECIELTISNSNAENSTVIDRRISIKNIGLGVAKDFTYTWCNLDGCYPRNDLGFTAFAPGEEKSIYFDFYAECNADFSEYEAPVSIIFSYSDLLENRYSSNYIPITPISIRSLQERAFRDGGSIEIGDMIERASARLSHVIDRGNKELHKLLTYLVREILRNTPEHAQADEMWICGQYWPTYQLAEIAIIDEGIGVFQSITRNAAHAKYIHDNRSALKWAIRAGISESFRPAYEFKPHDYDVWKNSGFGLYMVSQICQKLNGSFCIISYGDALLIDNHGVAEKRTSFHGTAIRIRVPTNNISAAQAIIDEIAAQGEVEARTIKNAFKTASMPSKGLMTQLNI